MKSTRLFKAIVIVGCSLGAAACEGGDGTGQGGAHADASYGVGHPGPLDGEDVLGGAPDTLGQPVEPDTLGQPVEPDADAAAPEDHAGHDAGEHGDAADHGDLGEGEDGWPTTK